MISINKYGQNIDLSKIVAVNGTKSISLDGLTLNETLIINVTKGMKFKSSLEENDLKIEFTDIDGSIFEVILKDMATLLAENDGEKLVEIVQTDDNKVLASITDITTALAAAAAGAEAPGAGNNGTNSDSAANNDGFADGLNLTPNVYDNATLPASINLAAALPVDETRRNFAPTIGTIAAQNVDEDNSLLINYIATDANNDALTATVTATNGTAVITEAGQILFTPNANFNGAAEIVLTITDGLLTTVQTITVTVNPVNDAPVLDTITAVTVSEDDSVFSGTITSSDVDANATAVYTTTSTVAGFTLNANGTYTFDAADVAYQSLAAGISQIITIPVTVTDDANATDTQNLTITITGTNDAPTVVAAPATTLSETDFATLSGNVNSYKIITETEMYSILGANDVDLNDSLTLSLVTDSSNFTSTNTGIDNTTSGVVQLTAADITALGITANVGDFFIYSTGFDGLNASETSTATFNVILSDGLAPVTSTVTLTVNGVNDAPTVVAAPATTLSETDFATLSGNVNSYKIITETEMYSILGANDVDLNDSLTLSLVTDSSNFTSTNTGIDNTTSGVVQLTAADITALGITANVGDFFIYSLGFDGLNASETSTATFNVILSDGLAPVTSTVTLTVNGVNDAPTVVAAPATTLSETDFATLAGFPNSYKIITETEMYSILGANDVDLNDSLTLSLVTDSSNFTSTNTGIDNTTSGVVQLTAADITALGITANVGDFFIYSTGFDGLNASETSTATFNVILSDGLAPVTSTVTLTVDGVNDAPTVSVTPVSLSETDFATLAGYENAYKIITEAEMYVILGADDVDLNDSLTLSLVTDSSDFTSTTNAGIVNSNSGVVQLTAADIVGYGLTGVANVGDFFIYSIGFDGLNVTDVANVTFDVILSDGTSPVTSTVSLTVDGVNDAPTVSVTPVSLSETDFATLAGYENAYKIITEAEMYVILGADDVDLNDSLTLSLVTDSSDFTSTTNAGIVNSNSGVVQLTAADIVGYGLTGVANVGDFFIYSIGFDGLNVTDVANVTFDVILSDGTSPVTSTVSLTVDGVNDAPTVSVTPVSLSETDFATLAGYENAYKIITEAEMYVILGADDVDLNDSLTLSLVTDSSDFTSTTNAGIVNSNSGVVQLTAADIVGYGLTGVANVGDFFIYSIGFDGLNVTDVANVTFDVILSDGTSPVTSTVSLTVDGVNDAPTVSVTPVSLSETDFATLAGYENAYKIITEAEMYVILGADDVDLNDSLTLSLVTDSSDFTSTTNAGIVNSNSGVVQLTAADIVGYGLTGVANVGDFFIYSIGFDGLNVTDVANVTFDVILSDGTSPVTSTVSLTVDGVNDAPTVSVTPVSLSETDFATLAGYENAYKIITEAEMYVILGADDVDLNDSLTLSLVTDSSDFTSTTNAGIVNSNSGVVQLTAADIVGYGLTGVANVGDFFIYSIGFDGLNVTDVANVTFDVILSDGTSPVTSTVSLTVDGVNDAPVVTSVVVINVDENQLDNANNSTLTVAVDDEYALHNFVYDLDVTDDHNFNRLGTTLSLTITTSSAGLVHAFTSNNLDYIKGVALEIVAIPEIATALASVTNVTMLALIAQLQGANSVSQISAILTNVGIIPSISAAGLSLTFPDASILEEKGLLTIDLGTDGDGSYSVSSPLFNNLGITDTVSLSFDYLVTDSGNGTDTGSITVNIKGSNDIPTISDVSISTSENALTNSTKLEIDIDSPYALTNFTYDLDVTDDFNFEMATNSKIGFTLETMDPELLTAFQTNNVAYIKSVALQLLAIPEVAAAMSTITDPSALLLINSLNSATSVVQLFTIVNSITGVSATITASGLSLSIEDASILITKGLLAINIDGSGSYTVESALFDSLSVNDKVSISFDYVANDSGGATSEAKTITVNIQGSNDAPTVSVTPVSLSETDFATLAGYENAYKIITETEMYSILGANDVDVNDSLTLSLVTDSSNFTSTNTGIDNTTSGVVQLTAADITALGITANVGDFFIYSLGFDGLNASETSTATFNVILSDGTAPVTSTVTLTVNGVNDAPVASATSTIVANDVSYVGQLVASDVDLNDTLTYTYDNTSVSMTLSVTGLSNLDTLMAFNNASTLSALTELKAAASSFAVTGSLAGLLTLTPSTIAIGKTAVSTLLNFLNTNSGLGDIKDFIVDNRDVIIANTELSSDDITLIQGLLTTTNISALNSLFTTYETLMSTPSVQAAVQAILADNVISSAELSALSSNTTVQTFVVNAQSLLAANTAILSLIDIPTIISKLQSIITVDEVNGEVSVTAEIPSTTADVMIALDATTGEYTVTNPYLATLPDNTQVEVKFDYTVTDSAGASDDSTAAIMITSENVDKVSASLDDNGTLVMGDEKDIDMASLLSNITSNINVADIDSIDLSSNEHILSNLTIADFQEMVSDSSSNTLEIKGENNDIIKLDPAIWLKDTTDTDSNSVVDNTDDHFVPYKATGTDSQVLTLLIDKDIIVQDI